MNRDGSSLIRLTRNSAGDIFPIWPSDGSQIFFLSDRNGHREIYSIHTDKSIEKRLTFSTGDKNSLSWSHKHQKLAFHSTKNGISMIYLMDRDGSEIAKLIGHDGS